MEHETSKPLKPKSILKRPKIKSLEGTTHEYASNQHEQSQHAALGIQDEPSINIKEMSGKRKRDGEIETSGSNAAEDADLQEFFDSVENEIDNEIEQGIDLSHSNHHQVQKSITVDSSDVIQDGNPSSAESQARRSEMNNSDRPPRDDIEQVAYEARLAKLMLLTRQRGTGKRDIDETLDDSAKEVGAVLDMTSAGEFNDTTSAKDTPNNRDALDTILNTSSLREIIKQKKQKIKKRKDDGDHDDDDDWNKVDGYWSNF